MNDKKSVVRESFFPFLVFLFINSSLTLHRWLLGDGWWYLLVPSFETLVLGWAMVGASRLDTKKKNLVLVVMGVFYGSLVIYSGAEYVVQLIYGRGFVPTADIPMIRGVLLLLFGQIGSLADILTPVTQGLVLLVGWSFGFGVIKLGSSVLGSWKNPLPATAAISAIGAISFFVLSPPSVLSLTIASGIAAGKPVVFEDVLSQTPVAEEQLPADDAPSYAFPGILDRDIYVFAVEAYGYAAFSRDEIYTQLEPDFQELQASLTKAGYGVVSNYMRSPVAGGFSWLAEATLLTGQWINSQPVFEQLYETPVSTLPKFLYDGGYYTFTVKPGTVHGSWPEGWDLFGFKESMIAYDGDFDFRGPWFSYVPITDQFALYAAHQRIEQLRASAGEAENRPLFAYYQLVSSHTPFNKIPPYLEDWNELGDGSIYHELSDQILTFDNTWTGGTQLVEGYVASLSYVFTVLSEYIDQYLDPSGSPIIIILGDHQAQRPIREQTAHLSTPIHIASRDPDILEQFRQLGYTDGIRGEQPPPHRPMSDFFSLFVDVATTIRTQTMEK